MTTVVCLEGHYQMKREPLCEHLVLVYGWEGAVNGAAGFSSLRVHSGES